ncbi:MAG: hypothetical protein ACI8PT_002873 [Gammaproteobacteria bacterium]|jgi:hypothetical protein
MTMVGDGVDLRSAGAGSVADSVTPGPHRLQIGLKPLALDAWIEDQWDFADQLIERQRLVDEKTDVLASTGGHDEVVDELLDLLHEELPRILPQHYVMTPQGLLVRALGSVFPRECPSAIERVARLVPDDFCLMHADETGKYRLVAAALCFPTRWKLHTKIGREMTEIHAPVPDYERRLATGVERVFEAVRVERPMWRVNWSLIDSPNLYQPERILCSAAPLNVGDSLWLRSERQTIRRLSTTGCVVFSIRIRQLCLSEACAFDSTLAARLRAHLKTMSAPMVAYKGVGSNMAQINTWLEQRAAQAP